MSSSELPQWMACVYESIWHVPTSGGGASIQAVCGHRIRGPVHARRGGLSPAGNGRTLCQACAVAAFDELPTQRRVRFELALRVDEQPSAEPPVNLNWPTFDVDQLLPGGHRLLQAA